MRLPRPSLSPAAWLASTGASLLLVASIIVVASRWESIPAEVRFSGLVAALLAAYFVAESIRRRLPATAKALAALAASGTAPVGIAAAATIEQPWPVCVLVGGVLALAATEYQARRWQLPVLQAATVVAYGLAATGAAALTGVPAPLLGALGAASALAVGAARRSLALAAAVGVSPALALLAELGVGAGTLERVGAVGDVLSWSAPVSSTIAAAVVAVTAQRRQQLPLAVVALAVFAAGAVTGLVTGDVADVVWWCVPAVALLGLEALAAPRASAVWRRVATVAPLVAIPIAIAGLLAPFVPVTDRIAGLAHQPTAALPLLLSAVALLATAAGSGRHEPSGWGRPALLLGAAGYALGAATVAGAGLVVVATLSLVLWAGISSVTDWRTWELTTVATVWWGLLAATAEVAEPAWAQLGLIAGFAASLVLAISFVERADRGIRLVGAAVVIGGAVHAVAGSDRLIEALVGVVAVIAVGVSLRPRAALVPMVAAEAAVILSFLDARIDWWNVALVAGLAVAAAGAASGSIASPWAHLSAGAAVAAAALTLAAAGVDPTTATLLLGAAAVVSTALATSRSDARPLCTAAAVAGALTVTVSVAVDPVLVSLAVALAGAQAVVLGALAGRHALSAGGAIVFGGALVSLWWTTGTNALVLDAIAPYGASGADLVVGTTGLLLVGLGWGLRHVARSSSWLAYSPGLALLATWLLSTQLESGTDWATFGALALGIVASGVGGLRRLGAPLVIGTATSAATILISAGPRLAEAPTWVWIATGGVGLIVLAALVERNERPLLPTGDGESSSIVESFCRDFD